MNESGTTPTPPRVGEFEKVSFEQFYEAMKSEFDLGVPSFEDYVKSVYESIKLPLRATSGSAGYDFKSPIFIKLAPGASIKIPTGIRVRIEPGWFLACFPRSSLGFKYRLQLDNSVGIVDGDYFFSDNEGHIFAKMTNDGKEGKTLSIQTGDGFMQGIFLPYGITNSDNVQAVRNGGMGSTGA